jgi:hypothetical protein
MFLRLKTRNLLLCINGVSTRHQVAKNLTLA